MAMNRNNIRAEKDLFIKMVSALESDMNQGVDLNAPENYADIV